MELGESDLDSLAENLLSEDQPTTQIEMFEPDDEFCDDDLEEAFEEQEAEAFQADLSDSQKAGLANYAQDLSGKKVIDDSDEFVSGKWTGYYFILDLIFR